MPVRTIYLPDGLDAAVNAAVAERADDANRSNVIQDALRDSPAVADALETTNQEATDA